MRSRSFASGVVIIFLASMPVAVQQYRIERLSTVSLTDARADTILGEGRNVLATKDSSADVACAIELNRQGSVTTFMQPTTVNSSADFDQLCLTPGIHVVSQITWCGTPCANCLGCSQKPGNCIVVVRYTDSLEGQQWIHEYGHNKGLPDVSNVTRVMNASLTAQSTHVTQNECNAYTATSHLTQEGKASAGSESIQRSNADEAGLDVQQFVRRTYIHGVPYEEAIRFPKAAIPALLRMLQTPGDEPYWSNVAIVLGIIGDPDVAKTLVDFISASGGKISAAAHDGKVGAILGLGYLVHGTKDQSALSFLRNGVTSEGRLNDVAWLSPKAESVEQRRQVLFVALVQALGLTGTQEAAETLRITAARVGDKGLRGVLADAILLNTEVMRIGGRAFSRRP